MSNRRGSASRRPLSSGDVTARVRTGPMSRLFGSAGGRRAAWRRRVLRRCVAALSVAVAATTAFGVLRPASAHPPTRPVVVAARALPAGAVITASDLAVTPYPVDLAPEGAIRDASALVGRSVAGPVGRDEALTPGRLVDASLLADLPPGTIALPVTATAESMALVRPGLRVDGFLPGRPEPVLRDALVLAATAGRASPLDGSTSAARVLLAVEAGQASALFGNLDPAAPMSEVTFGVR